MVKKATIVQTIILIEAGGIFRAIALPACADGWFGAICQYRCHCPSNHCAKSGACLNNQGCLRGWFGLGCQYKDLAALPNVTITTNPKSADISWLSDNDEETCNNDPKLKAVTVTWQSEQLFTSLRFTVRDTDLISDINVFFNGSSFEKIPDCGGREVLSISEQTFEIHCDTREPITQVTLMGGDVKRLCSCHVNGGRRVAMKGEMSRSSEYAEAAVNTSAANGDDGLAGKGKVSNSCSLSYLRKDSTPTWTIVLPKEYIITRYILHSREGAYGHTLRSFRIQTFSSGNEFLSSFVINSTKAELVQGLLNSDIRRPIKQITITHTETAQKEIQRIRTLCGLEMFGECVPGTWGLQCQSCPNCYNGSCLRDNGLCVKGCLGHINPPQCNIPCNRSSWGLFCTRMCSITCKYTLCDSLNGSCTLGCVTGYEYDDCTQAITYEDSDRIAPNVTLGIVGFGFLVLVISVVAIIRSSKRKDKERVSEPYVYLEGSQNTSMAVAELHDFMQVHEEAFFVLQFHVISFSDNTCLKHLPQPQSVSHNAAFSEENQSKNHDSNIVPYDHSRVVLKSNSSIDGGDYINASYIKGFQNDRKIIASQGPTKHMVNDFVRMLWEQDVDLVVMLNDESKQTDHEQYWKDNDSVQFGEIFVQNIDDFIFADYKIRKLELRKETERCRALTQFQFTSWPEDGVPDLPWAFVDFEESVSKRRTDCPIVVHCGNGAGRTGTFIAFHNMMREAEKTGRFDFFKTVSRLRMDRVSMVQTAEQYLFLHCAAHIAVLCIGNMLTPKNFAEKMKHFDRSKMIREFSACIAMSDEYAVDNDDPKNRPDLGVDPKDGFKAICLSGLYAKDQIILLKQPDLERVEAFWKLMLLHKIKLVVAMDFEVENALETINYPVPSDDLVLKFGAFTIESKTLVVNELWESKMVTIKMMQGGTHFLLHLKSLFDQPAPDKIFRFLEHARSVDLDCEDMLVFTCKSGRKYSGLACVLSIILDRMEEDSSVIVPLVVGSIKSIERDIIPNIDQYRCLYQVIQKYIERYSRI